MDSMDFWTKVYDEFLVFGNDVEHSYRFDIGGLVLVVTEEWWHVGEKWIYPIVLSRHVISLTEDDEPIFRG